MCCRSSTQKKHREVLAKRLHITPIGRGGRRWRRAISFDDAARALAATDSAGAPNEGVMSNAWP